MTEQPPQPPPPPQPYGYYPPTPPTPSSATTALVLGIISLVVCQILGIAAIIIGRNSMREIDASQGRLGGRSTAQAGFILGIVSTTLFFLAIIFVAVVFAVGGLWFSHLDCSSSQNGQDYHFRCS